MCLYSSQQTHIVKTEARWDGRKIKAIYYNSNFNSKLDPLPTSHVSYTSVSSACIDPLRACKKC